MAEILQTSLKSTISITIDCLANLDGLHVLRLPASLRSEQHGGHLADEIQMYFREKKIVIWLRFAP